MHGRVQNVSGLGELACLDIIFRERQTIDSPFFDLICLVCLLSLHCPSTVEGCFLFVFQFGVCLGQIEHSESIEFFCSLLTDSSFMPMDSFFILFFFKVDYIYSLFISIFCFLQTFQSWLVLVSVELKEGMVIVQFLKRVGIERECLLRD